MAAPAPTYDLEVVFMTVPAEMIDDVSLNLVDNKRKKKRKRKANDTDKPRATPAGGFPLLSFSSEMLMSVMDHLDVQDIACLALSCKFLAALATHHNALTVKASHAIFSHVQGPIFEEWYRKNSDFFNRLKFGWIPRNGPGALGRCKRCSKFRPMSADFWIKYGMQKAVKYGGLAGRNWATNLARADGTIGLPRMNPQHSDFVAWTVTCPACELENP